MTRIRSWVTYPAEEKTVVQTYTILKLHLVLSGHSFSSSLSWLVQFLPKIGNFLCIGKNVVLGLLLKLAYFWWWDSQTYIYFTKKYRNRLCNISIVPSTTKLKGLEFSLKIILVLSGSKKC